MSFTRSLRYGESEQNVLDVATGGSDTAPASPRPVLLFVAGESFAGDNPAPDATDPQQDAAMCFAARNGMVGVRMTYRLAPAYPWPSGARDVAAATSWIHQNIDLFGGSRDEIVAVGYSVGAFHVASLLAHPELQDSESNVAGAVLVSGIYRPSTDASAAEKAYFGSDASQYEARSAFPGILNIETPLLLAWSAARSAAAGQRRRKAQGDAVQLRDPLPAHDSAQGSREYRVRVRTRSVRRRPRPADARTGPRNRGARPAVTRA